MPTVAKLVLLLLHVPPPVVDDRVVVLPIHTVEVPVRAAGRAFTVIDVVLTQPATA